MIYTVRIPMHAPVVVKAVGKKNGKVVLEITKSPRNPDAIGAYVRFTQDWLDTSPSVTKGDNL